MPIRVIVGILVVISEIGMISCNGDIKLAEAIELEIHKAINEKGDQCKNELVFSGRAKPHSDSNASIEGAKYRARLKAIENLMESLYAKAKCLELESSSSTIDAHSHSLRLSMLSPVMNDKVNDGYYEFSSRMSQAEYDNIFVKYLIQNRK